MTTDVRFFVVLVFMVTWLTRLALMPFGKHSFFKGRANGPGLQKQTEIR